jgi:hypothetical protein
MNLLTTVRTIFDPAWTTLKPKAGEWLGNPQRSPAQQRGMVMYYRYAFEASTPQLLLSYDA